MAEYPKVIGPDKAPEIIGGVFWRESDTPTGKVVPLDAIVVDPDAPSITITKNHRIEPPLVLWSSDETRVTKPGRYIFVGEA